MCILAGQFSLLFMSTGILVLMFLAVVALTAMGLSWSRRQRWWLKLKPSNKDLEFLAKFIQAEEYRSLQQIELAYITFEGEVEAEPELLDAIQELQRDKQSPPARAIDLNQTIKSIIRQGGFTSKLAYKEPSTRPSHYLFLIEQLAPQDHRAKTYGLIYRLFLEAGISCSRFYFSNDIRLCRSEQYPNGINLWHLNKYYPESHLVIIGSGRQLLSIADGRLAPWTIIFEDWPQRAVLSHNPTRQWGRMERNISRRFLILPASYQSFAALPELFQSEKSISGIYALQHTGSPQVSVQEGNVVEQLSMHFSPRHLHWIAACAIYPQLTWNLTLHIGQWFHEQVFVRDLLELSRLTWFIEGRIPEEARRELLEFLEENEPEKVEKLRKEIIQLWEKNQEALGAAAGE